MLTRRNFILFGIGFVVGFAYQRKSDNGKGGGL